MGLKLTNNSITGLCGFVAENPGIIMTYSNTLNYNAQLFKNFEFYGDSVQKIKKRSKNRAVVHGRAIKEHRD